MQRSASPFRTWNTDGTYPSPAQQTGCLGGTCRLFDWRVRNGGVAFHSSAAGGDPGGFIPGGECPAMTALTDGQNNTFLTDAFEIIDDGIGDNDGLCESAEACIYAPHIGAYLGEGELTEACRYTGTDTPGVTLVAFSQALAQ